MLAALLTFALFVVWSLFGVAALAALKADVTKLRIVLTAPMLGAALTVIPLFVLSNAGVPMTTGAPPVWAVLLVGSLVSIGIRRPSVPLAAAPVGAICVVGMVVLGRPMFQFGFDWIAEANGDMAHYVLSATQLMNHGLQSQVDYDALADNRDFATSAQQLTLRGLRPGTDITLAGLAAVTGRTPLALYMPMSIAVMMGTVCAAGALAMQASRRWWAASVAAALLVVSPMAAYGVLHQLLPQDWGLGLSAALFAWLMRPQVHQRRLQVLDVVVISLLAAALFVVAYEVAASLLVAYGLYVALLALRRKISLRTVIPLWGVPILATALTVNTFLSRALDYLIHYVLHFGTTGGFVGISQFGYAVVPTALPGAAGLQSLSAKPSTPHMTELILVAAALFLAVMGASLITARKGAAAGVTLLGNFAVGVLLAKNGNQFGLFKLYMYIQPFVAATLAVLLTGAKFRRHGAIVGAIIILIAAAQAPTLNHYVKRSMQPIDLRNASKNDLLPQFSRSLKAAKVPFVTVTDNYTLGVLEGALAGRKRVFFIGRNLFGVHWRNRTVTIPSTARVRRLSFAENGDASRVLARGSCLVALPTGSQVVYNRRSFPEDSSDLAMLPCGKAENIMIFVVSSLGQPATLPGNIRAVSFWQLEKDPWFPGHTFAGAGRYALFQILSASTSVRLSLNFTTSPVRFRSESQVLPAASVDGADRVRFPVLGSATSRSCQAGSTTACDPRRRFAAFRPTWGIPTSSTRESTRTAGSARSRMRSSPAGLEAA